MADTNNLRTCFRKLCNLAAEYGINHNATSLRVWKEREVKEEEKRAEVYLTDEELDAIYNYPFGTELRKEQNFIKLRKLKDSGGKLKKEDHRVLRNMMEYAKEHNGQPLYERDSCGQAVKFKYELVTTHTARRSGVTNMYKTGIFDKREMMSISGHQTEAIFENYTVYSVYKAQNHDVRQKILHGRNTMHRYFLMLERMLGLPRQLSLSV